MFLWLGCQNTVFADKVIIIIQSNFIMTPENVCMENSATLGVAKSFQLNHYED